MIYWLYEKEAGYEEWQVENAITEGRLNKNDYTPIDERDWQDLRNQSITQNKQIKNNPETNLPYLVNYPQPSQKELLEQELAECHQWFRLPNGSDEHAIKCMSLGLVFKDEYPKLYNEGIAKRARINEIEELLKSL